jgi:hypothetical protein
MGWFKFQESAPQPVQASVIPSTPYHEKMAESRDVLHWYVKKQSSSLSMKVYSEIRELEKTLKDINLFLEGFKPTAADEHLLDSIMKDYLPSAIELFMKLPEQGRKDGGEGDELLLKQCRTIARDLRNRNADMHERATKDLKTQAAFIEDRFSEGNMT